MSSPRFPYNWDNVIHVIKNIYSTINYKESKCDIYLWAIFHNHLFIVKKEIQMCSKLHRIFWKKGNVYMSNTNLVLVLTDKRGRKSSYSQFLTQTYWMNKISAYEAAKPWNRGISHKFLNHQSNRICFVSCFIVILNVSKKLSKVISFEIKWIKCRPMRHIQTEEGESLVIFFQNTNPILFVVFISWFFDLMYQRGYRGYHLLEIKCNKCRYMRQLRP